MRTLIIEADLWLASAESTDTGWSDILSDTPVEPRAASETAGLWVAPAGSAGAVDDRAVSALMVRAIYRHYSAALEDHFLVAYREQRGAGKSFDRLSAQFRQGSPSFAIPVRSTRRSCRILRHFRA
jgi:hypothetical protein